MLKGAAASALYGYRGKAGVILITTKSAKGNDGVDFNSNYVVERAFNLTNWQYQYGQGANGLKPDSAAGASQVGNSSWGAPIDGSGVVQFDGVSRPYSAQKNNIRNFYRTGGSLTNTLAFNKSFTGARCASRPATCTIRRWCPTRALIARRSTSWAPSTRLSA
ncbi:MAG: hypothetical protein WKG07_50060 [Hymenobacter sp.]